MPVEDAGKSEGSTVMVEIGVQDVPYPKGELTYLNKCV